MSDHILIKRRDATQKTVDKFMGRTFKWGSVDCLYLVRTQLVNMGRKGLPKIPNYSTFETAVRRLKNAGYDSLEDLLLDFTLEIPPALILPGDIITAKGETDISASAVYTGQQKFIGFAGEIDICTSIEVTPERAFRV